jgi:zinc protease
MKRFVRAIRYALALSIAGLFAGVSDAIAQSPAVKSRSPGGLEFHYIHLPQDQYQSLSFAWRDGSGFAMPGKEALPGIAPAMLIQGWKGTSFNEITEDLKDLNANLRLDGTSDIAYGQLVSAPKKFNEAAVILQKILANPAFPANKLEERLKLMHDNAVQGGKNPGSIAGRMLVRTIYASPGHYRYHAGEASLFSGITVEDLAAWHKAIIAKDNLVIVAAGPFTLDEVAATIDMTFGGLPARASRPPATLTTYRQLGKMIVLERDVQQTIISFGGVGELASRPGDPTNSIAASIFGGGPQSRLFKAVREKLGAAYNISASLISAENREHLMIGSTAVSHDKAKAAIDAIREEYRLFLADGVTKDEVAPILARIASGFGEAIKRSGSASNTLLSLLQHGGSVERYNEIGELLKTVNADAVNASIRQRFPKNPLTMVIVTPKAEGLGADCVIKAAEELEKCL